MCGVSINNINTHNVELFDISCDKLEKYVITKIAKISYNDNNAQQIITEITSLKHEQSDKNIWIIYKHSLVMLFDTKLLQNNYVQRFQEVLFEMLKRKAGFNRIKSLLLLKILGYIRNCKFPIWKSKILITCTRKNSGFFLPNNLRYNQSSSDFLHEISMPLDNLCTSYLSKILMHETTHLYNFRILGDMVGERNSMESKIITKNSTMAALSNKILRQHIFPSHVKENFDALVYDVEQFLKKIVYLEMNDELFCSLRKLHRFLMINPYNENSSEIPLVDLISNWNIKKISFNFMNRKIAELLTAAIISSKNYWENKDELLTISGIVTAKTTQKTIVIFSNENENTFGAENGKLRFSYGKLFFCKTPSLHLSNLLKIIKIKHEDLLKILQTKMEKIRVFP